MSLPKKLTYRLTMLESYDKFVKLTIQELAETTADFSRIKKKVSKLLQLPIPSNANLREIYNKLVLQKQIKPDEKIEKLLIGKKNRTHSGVAVIAVLTKPFPCPGKCLYCPSENKMPKSYLKNEPAVMRAISVNFDPYAQVQKRLRSLELNGHKTDKIELIVMGGTFSYLPKNYQKQFVKECFRATNDYPKTHIPPTKDKVEAKLLKEQKKNEKANRRIIGLTLETRPDYINEKEILNFRALGCTRVELGVQNIFDDILQKNNRGHNVSETIRATRILKDCGFKISYHIMPGLLGSTIEKDFQMFQTLFSSPDFQPDLLKIYPTVVLKDSELYSIWKNGKYIPLDNKQFREFILRIKEKVIPPFVRISRLVRDVPAESILAGPTISNLRQLIESESKCQCIRCREIKDNWQAKEEIILDRIDYAASFGQEIFLQLVSKDKQKLFALLRLRIAENNNQNNSIKSLQNTALIREVHTYGKLTELNKTNVFSPQHIGMGKKMITEAEKIAKVEFGLKKIAVISGIGVRNYYRKLGYRLKDSYMIKKIK
jgi:elongator complex protein 3